MWWLTVLPLASAYGERYYVAAPVFSPLASNLGIPLAAPYTAPAVQGAALYSGAAPAVHAIPSGESDTMQWMPTFVVMLALTGSLALREKSLKVHRAPQPAGGYARPQLRTAQRLQRAGAIAMMAKKAAKKKDVQVVLKTGVKGVGKAG